MQSIEQRLIKIEAQNEKLRKRPDTTGFHVARNL